jgi:ABC-type antimicrobial peptide transport system permease subunit
LYLALNQRAPASTYLVIKTAGDPRVLASGMRAAVASIDRDLVPYDVFPMDDLLQNSPNALLPLRVGAVFASSVGLLAVFLTTMGLYGLIAFMVTQRTREIGLRMALGADRWTVVRSILGQGGRLAGVGIALGLVGAFLVTRALGSLLIGVRVTDVSVFAAVAVGLALVTLASAFVPARRASRIDPVTALNKDG